MFEIELKDMKALVFIESEAYNMLTAANVGISSDIIFEGYHEYTFNDALSVIRDMDKMILSVPKRYMKKISSYRNSFVLAFGPDMEEFINRNPSIS